MRVDKYDLREELSDMRSALQHFCVAEPDQMLCVLSAGFATAPRLHDGKRQKTFFHHPLYDLDRRYVGVAVTSALMRGFGKNRRGKGVHFIKTQMFKLITHSLSPYVGLIC